MAVLGAAACSSGTSGDATAPTSVPTAGAPSGATTQVGTITALNQGRFTGVAPIKDLRAAGDLGLGTYDRLDGEMVVLDGEVWQVPADGVPRPATDAQTTPFAQVTWFEPTDSFTIAGPVSCADLGPAIDRHLDPADGVVALRVDGSFSAVTVRSVPAQSPPFAPLADVVATQQVTFDLGAVGGTLVGFRSGADLSSVAPTGYHFHFLTDDRAHGGHALSCTADQVTVQVDPSPVLDLAVSPTVSPGAP